MRQNEKMIGIIGGMGPEAGRLLHGLIIEETKKMRIVSQDQDHCDILHFSLPAMIPDRATYIFDQTQANPNDVLIEIIRSAAFVGQHLKRQIVTVIPCNTFHAPVLFNDLRDRIQTEGLSEWIVLKDFVKEAVNGIVDTFPGIKKIGLLSTTGTRKTLIYAQALETQGIALEQVTEQDQQDIDAVIYNPIDGLKALSKASLQTKKVLKESIRALRDQGAEKVILGCTEFPLAFEDNENEEKEDLIDPMRLVARRLIQMASGTENVS